MKIGVLGTGSVGQTIGTRLLELGHQVCLGSRSKGNEKALNWVQQQAQGASEGSFADAADFGELIFNCSSGVHSLAVMKAAGPDNLAGKLLIDVANPLDFSKGMPPSLTVCNTDSLGEQIQRALPATQVVKALNTMWCGVMVNPGLIAGEHHTFICGNDHEAKQKTRQLLHSFGWPDASILDLGDISNARGTEAWLPLWVRLYGPMGSGAFNLRLVKAETAV